MTSNEQALFAMMQDLSYSHGLCITALQILSQDRLAVSEMLAYLSVFASPEVGLLGQCSYAPSMKYTYST